MQMNESDVIVELRKRHEDEIDQIVEDHRLEVKLLEEDHEELLKTKTKEIIVATLGWGFAGLLALFLYSISMYGCGHGAATAHYRQQAIDNGVAVWELDQDTLEKEFRWKRQ